MASVLLPLSQVGVHHPVAPQAVESMVQSAEVGVGTIPVFQLYRKQTTLMFWQHHHVD